MKKQPIRSLFISRTTNRHRGFTITELVVAASLLVTVLSVITPLAVRSNRLWQQTRYYRLAVEELTNQLEYLTSLDSAQRAEALEKLAPSMAISNTLPNPVLTAETRSDDDGNRLILSLTWDRLGENVPVTLVGWFEPPPVEPNATLGGSEL